MSMSLFPYDVRLAGEERDDSRGLAYFAAAGDVEIYCRAEIFFRLGDSARGLQALWVGRWRRDGAGDSEKVSQ